MIGEQETGRIPDVTISAVSHETLTVTVDGKPGELAVLAEDGSVIAHGPQVAREAQAVSINSYRRFLQGKGWLRVFSGPLR